MRQREALRNQSAEREAREIELMEADVIGEREDIADEVIDFITPFHQRRTSMTAQIERQDTECVPQLRDNAFPCLKVRAHAVDANQRTRTLAFEPVIQRDATAIERR